MYQNKPGSYRYIHEKSKMIDVHDVWIRIKDLKHSMLRTLPLRYERELLGGKIDKSRSLYTEQDIHYTWTSWI